MKITTVFFDLGNTLLYSDVPSPERVQAACKVMANEFAGRGYPVTPEEFAAKHFENLLKYYDIREQENIEQGAESVFRQTLADFGFTGVPEKDIAAFLASFYRTTQGNWHLDEDAIPTLEKIITQQRRIGLITNAGYAEDIRQLLRKNKLEPYFSSVSYPPRSGFANPTRKSFKLRCGKWAARPNKASWLATRCSRTSTAHPVAGCELFGSENTPVIRRTFPVFAIRTMSCSRFVSCRISSKNRRRSRINFPPLAAGSAGKSGCPAG